jgi:hypothetical protein
MKDSFDKRYSIYKMKGNIDETPSCLRQVETDLLHIRPICANTNLIQFTFNTLPLSKQFQWINLLNGKSNNKTWSRNTAALCLEPRY